MNIHKATQSYENWMRSCTAVIEAHLRLKHKRMRESPFLFFRGTFYRWAQLGTGIRHGHQEFNRHMRRDRTTADLLLHTFREQFYQCQPARHPTHAAIKT